MKKVAVQEGKVRIRSAASIVVPKRSWLIVGRPKSGKTAFTGTFPTPILTTNFANEDGASTLMGHPDCDVVDVQCSYDVEALLDFVFEQVAANAFKYKTVVLDSLTSWVEMMRTEHIQAGGPVSMPAVLPYYANWGQRVIEAVDRLRRVDAERVYTTTVSLNKDEFTGKMVGGPLLFKSLEERVPAKVDAHLYIAAETEKDNTTTRRLYLTPHDGFDAGVRGYFGPGVVDVPSYSAVMEELQSALFKEDIPQEQVTDKEKE